MEITTDERVRDEVVLRAYALSAERSARRAEEELRQLLLVCRRAGTGTAVASGLRLTQLAAEQVLAISLPSESGSKLTAAAAGYVARIEIAQERARVAMAAAQKAHNDYFRKQRQ